MEITERIDWLTLTKVEKNMTDRFVASASRAALWAVSRLKELDVKEISLVSLPGKRFYPHSFKDVRTGIVVDVAENLEAQGVRVTLSGQVLNSSVHPVDLLRHALAAGFKVTRMDVALDVYNSGITVDWMASQFIWGKNGGLSRSHGHVVSKHGETLYIGSRTSDRFMRVYDKAGEQGVLADWIRLEIEVKGDVVEEFARTYIEKPQIAVAEMSRLMNLPDNDLSTYMELLAVGMAVIKVGRKKIKQSKQVWLEGVLLPALWRLREDDPEAYGEIMDIIYAIANNADETMLSEGVVEKPE